MTGQLGQGGCGVVYSAIDEDGAPLALKTIFNGRASDRFERECRLLLKLRHPNIVGVRGTINWANRVFLIMDHVPGESVRALLDRRHNFSIPNVVDIATSMCLALEHAHQQDIVHRDVTPGNILITNNSVPMLLDFGISRSADDTQITRHGELLGTPGFIAPEVLHGALATPAADQFGLGRTLFEMCTDPNKPMIEPKGVLALLTASLDLDWTRLRSTADVDAVRPVLARMLARTPEGRFTSMGAAARYWGALANDREMATVHEFSAVVAEDSERPTDAPLGLCEDIRPACAEPDDLDPITEINLRYEYE